MTKDWSRRSRPSARRIGPRCVISLESAPAIGRPRRFRQPGLRSWQVPGFRRWLLFYRPLDQDRGIELIRVVHGARDLRRILGNPL
ncbi:MAG: type II toxin-antitoxin system RelE/ParE family toxin [Verrucomicrobia bacterium]|nr:type II toxin-antitoxin system RelE/ParE family toxin [Verrucomicrobiota bacterium]